ncbi:MAG: hypothetical protein ACREKL_14835 [Chthoniobacterales bacterium]
MRRFFATALACGIALSRLNAAPTTEEQTIYDDSVQAVVDAINTYRVGLGKTQVTALKELCQAARESAEFQTLNVGVNKTSFVRAGDAGYTGLFLPANSAFTAAGHMSPVDLLDFIKTNGTFAAVLADTTAASVGVGIAMKADGVDSEIRLFIVLGKLNGMSLGGTAGIEVGTGRGLVDPTDIAAILAGAYIGDSINGFVYDPDAIVFTTAVIEKFNNALKKLFKKPPVIAASVGKAVTFKLPPDVVKLIEKFKLAGKLPPGVKFDKKHGSFRGAPTKGGSFTVRLGGSLKAAVNGSKKLKPIKIQFKIGG